MDKICIKGLCVLVVCLSALLSVQVGEGESSPTYSLTDQDLDDLLAPIALYPDPLLAQILVGLDVSDRGCRCSSVVKWRRGSIKY